MVFTRANGMSHEITKEDHSPKTMFDQLRWQNTTRGTVGRIVSTGYVVPSLWWYLVDDFGYTVPYMF